MLDYAALLDQGFLTIAQIDHATGKALGLDLLRSEFRDAHDNDWIYLAYQTGLTSRTDPTTIELDVEFHCEWLCNANWPDEPLSPDLDPGEHYPLTVSIEIVYSDTCEHIDDPTTRARVLAEAREMFDDIDGILARHLGWGKPHQTSRPQQMTLPF